ncbi:hypothetical protein Lal_00010804 [Lupinus albus]|nr:hypothetical protein Lal_00010804 [Lupinus albus]
MESSFPFSSPKTVRWGFMMEREMAATTMATVVHGGKATSIPSCFPRVHPRQITGVDGVATRDRTMQRRLDWVQGFIRRFLMISHSFALPISTPYGFPKCKYNAVGLRTETVPKGSP